MSVSEPNTMQHEDITNRSNLLVLRSPVKFILISINFYVTKFSRFWALGGVTSAPLGGRMVTDECSQSSHLVTV